jgi:hypothetical protein
VKLAGKGTYHDHQTNRSFLDQSQSSAEGPHDLY